MTMYNLENMIRTNQHINLQKARSLIHPPWCKVGFEII